MLILFLCLTFVLGLVFLGIKSIEYHEKWEKHHIPGIRYSTENFTNPASDPEVYKEYHDKPLPPDMAAKTEMYFFLYFAMTGMHALHMIIGIAILGFMIARARAGAYTTGHVTYVENFGLYWHFVDIIWIYPLRPAVSDQQALRNEGMSETNAQHEQGHHIVSPKIYVMILLALLFFTGLTVAASYVDMGETRLAIGHFDTGFTLYWNPVVALAIACTKMILVVLFFMHVKYSTKLTKLTIMSGFFIFLG